MSGGIAYGPNRAPFTIGGRLLLLSDLFAALAGSSLLPSQGGPMPTTGQVGWWNASEGQAWGTSIYGIADSSPANKAASTGGTVAAARLAGSLGGTFRFPYPGGFVTYPCIGDYSVAATGVAVGASGAFSVWLAWSRATLKQDAAGALNKSPVTLLTIGTTPVLQMGGAGDGADMLTLFPGGSAVSAVGSVIELRHTHHARLVFSGSTVDVWLDGNRVISGAANQITLGATANLAFLPNAGLIFHEAAAWDHAHSGTESAALTAYAARYPLGQRRAAYGMLLGQSNAAKLLTNAVELYKSVAYLTGSLSSSLLYTDGSASGGNIAGGQTIFSGSGVFAANSTVSFLNAGGGSGASSGWPLGVQGNAVMAALDAMTADQKANLRYVLFFWSETDSAGLTYANKTLFKTYIAEVFARIRARLGVTAARLPILVINALPFDVNTEGCQTHREAMQDLVNDASLNVRFALTHSADAIGDGDTQNAATWLEEGVGNSSHRHTDDMLGYNYRMPYVIADAALKANTAANTPDVTTALDASLPTKGGPRIASAVYEGTAYAATGSVLVTIAHDAGTDLVLPQRALLGVGWEVMDGVNASTAGTPGAPGTRIKAIACSRVSATQLRVTLDSQPAYPAKAQLYYGYGTQLENSTGAYYAVIGRKNAVTDNFSAKTLPSGWKIGADRGVGYQPNMPIQATTYGVPLN